MKTLQSLLLLLLVAISPTSLAAGVPEGFPHADAIRLVMQLRGDEIQRLDRSPDWWHDTKERTWSVKRPFGPGIVDSTHYFQVSYSIDGKVVGTWSVNTGSGQVAGPGESIRIE
ncbi:hypothetical protein ABB26_11525 [Stenotrophomonas humi]|uniref:Uncharacterized protein n=1 Tax=Stenotrophomonas humi TaxID=405444 RepID=A0A0R0C139_9GAMM|nr:hypothetical protein ABB26_11525 [Stenotrophomonas humi]